MHDLKYRLEIYYHAFHRKYGLAYLLNDDGLPAIRRIGHQSTYLWGVRCTDATLQTLRWEHWITAARVHSR